MSGSNNFGGGALLPSPAAPQAAPANQEPNTAAPTTAAAPEGAAVRAGDAAPERKAAASVATAVERTAAQAAAAQAAAISAKGAAAAARAALAADVVAYEKEITATATKGDAEGGARPAVYSRSGEEAVAAAARAATDATSAASEAASAAAAVAEAANGNADCQTSSQLEDFLVSQGLRAALALESAATAAAAAADAASRVAATATRQAAEKSSSAIAAAAQRCHEAATSAAASAVAAFSAAASSTADSITSTAAAARAAIEEATGVATQKLIETAKAFEDTIASKTAALENALLWRESVKSHDSEASRSRSSSSSSFVAYRLRSSSQLSSSSSRSRRRGRSSLLHYFSSDYEREGSQGGAPEPPLNSAGTVESAATAEGALMGDAAVAAFLSGCEDALLPRASGLDVNSASEAEEGASRPEQRPNVAAVAATSTVQRKDSVDAIVAAAAAEAAASEAVAKQQLYNQQEASSFFSPFGSLSEAPAVAAPLEAGTAISPRVAAKAAQPNSTTDLRTITTDCSKSDAPEATEPCVDTEEGRPQKKVLQRQASHASAPPHSVTEPQEHGQVQVQQQQTSQYPRGKDLQEWHRDKVDEDGTNSSQLEGTACTCSTCSSSRGMSGPFPFTLQHRQALMTRLAGLEMTAASLEDPVSFTLIAEVLQHLQEEGLLHSLLLLRITGYRNADLRASLPPDRQRRICELQRSAAAQFRPLRREASAALAASEAAAPTGDRGNTARRDGPCSGTRNVGRNRSVSSSRSSASSSNSRSSSYSRCSSWVKQPLYVPPLQLQRSLRAVCGLLPQLQRLELLAPKAKTDNDSNGAHGDSGEKVEAASGSPVFSKLSRVLAYISPFAVLVQSLGFQLFSIRVTELLLHCNTCYRRGSVAGSGGRTSCRREDSKENISSSSCCRLGNESSNSINCSGGVNEGYTGPSSSARTSTATIQNRETTPDPCRGAASRSSTSYYNDESPVYGPEEETGVSAIIKGTVCMSCDACFAPIHGAAAVTTAAKQQGQWYVLDSVVFLRTRDTGE
ncbi:hypothetical protein, conserved [Eimeria brunetti]|uniref:Uncharacterized protein n=1 Tax=Eimeria brunetti TaxID=51314 RepID=U6M1T1_9EIME|nr:hypothetical protein, conserved [Eimeria brunetti]